LCTDLSTDLEDNRKWDRRMAQHHEHRDLHRYQSEAACGCPGAIASSVQLKGAHHVTIFRLSVDRIAADRCFRRFRHGRRIGDTLIAQVCPEPNATPCLTLSSGWAPRVASDDGIILAIIVNVHVRTTARSAVADRKTAVTQVRACEAG
jgi:hypothetical protein